jgi:hypothetical protein
MLKEMETLYCSKKKATLTWPRDRKSNGDSENGDGKHHDYN